MNSVIHEMKEWLYLLWAKKRAAQDIQNGPQKFEGLYEPIYRLSRDDAFPVSAMEEWRIRANYLNPESSLARVTTFCAGSQAAKKHPRYFAKYLLHCFELAGASRDMPDLDGRLVVNPQQASAYRALDGHTIYAGEDIHIIAAAWYCNGLVIEHGLAGEIT